MIVRLHANSINFSILILALTSREANEMFAHKAAYLYLISTNYGIGDYLLI